MNPSRWTLKTDFKRSYQRVGDFWLPESNESETKVRIFGTAVLTTNYGEYQITEAPGVKTAWSSEKPSNGSKGRYRLRGNHYAVVFLISAQSAAA